ncbi:glycoside hydrolase [Phycisphaera mikurensis]|uniref:CBM-cenC domain-containing protein n=1 Tax=Phycisphaera mikurensis (strain NBRC 102666 / KCTC 22515 / FYK2301M01) TaxID=1142394 RepID=I0IBN2_PHYMF|nr:hypothetical protein [Phycisphaera mikurensis]MBB6442801.1 hypothetical protein [Phycisphaera mikurensis]BAM02670.1 hypothetical protein PSMK_05110 [Phycisphaera mikurensis NBRC 102666]
MVLLSRRILPLLVLAACSLAPAARPAAAASLANASLEAGTAGWGLETQAGAEATLRLDPEGGPDGKPALVIDVTKVTDKAWHVQLMNYAGSPVEDGVRYTLTFSSKADGPLNVFTTLQEDGGGYANATEPKGLDFSSRWESERVTLTGKGDHAKTRYVLGNLGKRVQTIRLSDFALVGPGEAATPAASTPPAGGAPAAAPATGDAAALEARASAAARREKLGSVVQFNPRPAQEVLGWGGHVVGNEYWDTSTPDLVDVPAALEAYYRDLGLTFVRLNVHWDAKVTGGTPSPAYAAMRDRLRAAQSHGIDDYILSCWSAPTSMKTGKGNKGYFDANENRRYDPGEPLSLLPEENEDAFIDWYVGVVRQLDDDGLGLPLNVSVQNEPDQLAAHENTLMTPEQWARLTVKMRAALDAAGLQAVGILGPDTNYTNAMATQWEVRGGTAVGFDPDETFGEGFLGGIGFTRLDENPKLDAALAGYAFHSYAQHHLPALQVGLARHPKPLWQTENSDAGGNDDFSWALFQFRHFLSDLVDVPNHYWAHWIKPRVGTEPSKWGMVMVDPDTQEVTPSKKHVAFSALWSKVRPGWRVHPMRTNDPDLRANGAGQDGWVNVDLLGFTSPDGAESVVALVNPTRGPKSLTLVGLDASEFQLRSTDADRDDALLAGGAVDRGSLRVELPPFSINLLHATGGLGDTN